MIFGPFERMVAFRYLRARRQEGFVSVIAIFSLLGIALGVATLIIVMSVMNGFRAELVGRILGLNGHLARLRRDQPAQGFRRRRRQGAAGPGRGQRDAADRGPGHGDQPVAAPPARWCAASARRTSAPRKLIADNIVAGSLAEFGDDGDRGRRAGWRSGSGSMSAARSR